MPKMNEIKRVISLPKKDIHEKKNEIAGTSNKFAIMNLDSARKLIVKAKLEAMNTATPRK
jgi:hypothetical protein